MENNNPLFSIITVSFNSAQTIERTILSILNQTYKKIEYIIIDGGSTDGTTDIIKKYSNRISYWVSEKDEGISDAFNKGILASHGEIIGIINSDDWYELDALETIVKLDSLKNTDFYVGALKYWNGKNSIIIYPDKNYKKTISFRMPHLNHPASFFKKKTYNEIGLFNTKYKYAMDYDLFLRTFLLNKKCYFTNQVLSNMQLGGVSDVNNKKAYKEVYLICSNKTLGMIWYYWSLFKIKIKKIIVILGGYNLLFLIKKYLLYKNKKIK